ncbi:MAG: hypothetical protein R2932_41020 [Caldilineaceae bacterium]
MILVGFTFTPAAIWAQDDDNPGTIPNGTIPGDRLLYLPIVARQAAVDSPSPTPPATPEPAFNAIPIAGAPSDRPAAEHPDLNLAIRSYVSTSGELTLVNNDGPTDTNAPQMNAIFQPARLPTFTALYQVHDWDWACGATGCRRDPLQTPPVTLVAMATTPGEALHIPSRGPQIYAGGYKALVLYADATRITLAYTRDDTAAVGYIVHMEDIRVMSTLLTLYQEKDAAGRHELPALHNDEPFATAAGASIKLAIRDTGSFMDPRSRKDWWVGFVSQ